MNTYYLFLRDDPSIFAQLSPSEIQAVIERYVRWREANSGVVTGGQKLVDGAGQVLRRSGGSVKASDGPFAEAKEILGGFFSISASSDEAARAIAESCPHLEFGSIEIRKVEPT